MDYPSVIGSFSAACYTSIWLKTQYVYTWILPSIKTDTYEAIAQRSWK